MDGQNQICWVCFPQRDGFAPLRGELAAARREFFARSRRTVRVERACAIKGFSGHVRGRISRRGFYWKKTVQGAASGPVALEEAFGCLDGWLVTSRDLRGIITSRTFFDREHRWTRSEYYEPWNPASPRVIFLPGEDLHTVQRQDVDPKTGNSRTTILHTAPYASGTAGQSLTDAQFGPPQLVLATTEGELCCCSQPEAQARAKVREEASGTLVLMPAWEVKDGELVDDGEDSSITFTTLEEYARIQPEESGLPEEQEPAPPAAAAFPEESPANPQEEVFHPGEELADLETSPVPEPEKEPAPPETGEPGCSPEDGPSSWEEEDSPLPAGTLEAILAEAAAIAPEEPPQSPAASRLVPQGYVGDIREGTVTGRGRTPQPGGMTSYEGEYRNGKRHGFGSYYYKDGGLCYAGFWKEDRRDGLGVSFRDGDHALHVAQWQEGQPQGLVSLFDSKGGLRYSGRMENGKKEGAGVVVNGQDGTVFVGQWSGGEATGLGSAFDKEGRLLYYGGWKDGKRHGHGTEFDQNGGVVFDGEFREGSYYNGVLYQKLSQPEWEQER